MLGVLGGGIAFAWGLSSDAYKVAKAHAETAPEAISRFGPVKGVSIRSFHLRSENARYSFSVEGEKAKGVITLLLQKDPEWRVVRVESSE